MKFLVIGLGSMGKRRIRNVRQLKGGDIAGYDLRSDRRDEVASEYGIPVFDDLDNALSKFAPDALIVSTPPNLHMALAERGLSLGKHVFSEAGTTTEGMAQVIKLADRTGLVAAPSCTMRFQPSIKLMKQLLDQNAIGRILTFTHHCGQYLPDWHPFEDYRKYYVSRQETAACREMVPFELTWLLWLMQQDVRSVAALRGKVSDLECEVDDVFQLLMRFSRGTLGHLLIDVVARAPIRATRILGETGVLEWNAGLQSLRHYDAATRLWTEYPEPPPSVEQGYSSMSAEGMYIGEMNAFIKACRGEAPFPYTFAEDVQMIEIMRAAEKSSDTGSHVELV